MDASEQKNAHQESRNPPINHNAIRTIKHLADALNSVQKLDLATSEACIASRWLLAGIDAELTRLWGRCHG
jgi:hypothetical protein